MTDANSSIFYALPLKYIPVDGSDPYQRPTQVTFVEIRGLVSPGRRVRVRSRPRTDPSVLLGTIDKGSGPCLGFKPLESFTCSKEKKGVPVSGPYLHILRRLKNLFVKGGVLSVGH